ncbi:glycerophosphodiester phosphodiesterase [Halobacillus massiliensis]|uniref:glycerophosphodiester phosphodiesterase n=1 Tax=Halobacillus massiliensis TaxID=1926286 RepID=UPI0009E47758|nr:glycerophosphodiester phosphodiesterase [Halobacillus massiliensis]
MAKTLIYAHRGASRMAPENTMAAYQLASDAGADGLEIDVQLTKDNIPVLIHDETVRRTTNGTGFVQDYTGEQIKKLDAGSWFSTKYSDCSILTLEEFLCWFKPLPMVLNVELKTNVIEYKKIEEIVLDLLKKYDVLYRTVISSFNLNSVTRVHELNKKVPTAFLTSTARRNLPNFAQEHGASDLHVKYRLLDRKLLDQCQKEKMPLRVYTINRYSYMAKCFRLGCDGIFTDVPHQAVAYRDKIQNSRTL